VVVAHLEAEDEQPTVAGPGEVEAHRSPSLRVRSARYQVRRRSELWRRQRQFLDARYRQIQRRHRRFLAPKLLRQPQPVSKGVFARV
jgi:hypothetical protein